MLLSPETPNTGTSLRTLLALRAQRRASGGQGGIRHRDGLSPPQACHGLPSDKLPGLQPCRMGGRGKGEMSYQVVHTLGIVDWARSGRLGQSVQLDLLS